jgi:hypothetical protein
MHVTPKEIVILIFIFEVKINIIIIFTIYLLDYIKIIYFINLVNISLILRKLNSWAFLLK